MELSSTGDRDQYFLYSFYNQNMPKNYITILIILFHYAVVHTQSQCCVQFNIDQCIRCPKGMHLYRSNCIYDIEGCLEYQSGFDCLTCRPNYKLNHGKCTHQRYAVGASNDSSFAVYLQSTLKPDPMLRVGREMLQGSKTMWIEWYNQSLISNKTYLNKNTLVSNALKLMNLTIKATPQYIFTSSKEKGNTSLLLYRFTFEVTLFGGFVDCLVLVQAINGQFNYAQLNHAKFNLLSDQAGWIEVKTGSKDQVYILSRINSLFPKSNNESHIKGYSRVSDGAVNFTMFFINYNEGVVPYFYIADPNEVPSLQSGTNKQQPISNNSTSSSNSTSSQQKATDKTSGSKMDNKTSDQSTNTTKDAKNACVVSCNQITMELSSIQANPIYSIGLAVIAQQYQIPQYSLQQIFNINTSPTTYGVYLNSSLLFYRFTFRINQLSNQFQILNYTQSSLPFITTNRTATTNQTKQQSNNKPDVPLPSNTSNIATNQTSCNAYNIMQGFIDITNKQANDIFLPRINLLLKTVYPTILQNSHISLVKFNLGLNPVSLNNITYQITYENFNKKTFYFEVSIINNQFQIIKSPEITSSNPSTQSDKSASSSTATATETNHRKTDDSQANITTTKPQSTNNDSKQQSNKTSNQNTAIPSNTSPSNQTQPKQQTKSNKTNPSNSSQPKNNTDKTTQPPITTNSTNKAWPIQIPQKNFTSDPKYKSLITILRSLYRIPANASVASMQEWQKIDRDSRYQIAFNMSYKNQLPDGTICKISTYNITINLSSFVSVKDERIEYIKVQPDKSQTQTAINTPSGLSSSQPALPSIPPYQKPLSSILMIHSPGLATFKMVSQFRQLMRTTHGGEVKVYFEKVKFINSKVSICFEVIYELITQAINKGIQEELINLLKYQTVFCQQPKQSQYIQVNLANYTTLDRSINEQIIKINKNSPLNINVYQKWSTFYRIRFNSMNYGKKQIVVDSLNSVTVLYRTVPQLLYSELTKNNTLLQPKIAEILRSQMQKILKLSQGSLSLQFIKRTNDNKQLQLLDIYGKTKVKSMWSQPIYQYFKMSSLYWPAESFTKIMSIQVFDLSYNQYDIRSNKKDWVQLSTRQTFLQNIFSSIIASLKQAYSGFMSNSQLLAIYRDNAQSNTTLKEYITNPEGARLYIAIIKKFPSFGYQSAYLITLRYKYAVNTSYIQNLQNLQLANITNKNCQETSEDDMNHMPKCKKCKQGFRLLDNFCYPTIQGCLQSMNRYCMKCDNNLMSSQDMLECESQAKPSERMNIEKAINAYLWQLNH